MEYTFRQFLEEKANVASDQVAEIMELVSFQEVKKGESLLEAGKVCDYIFFVEKGLLRLFLFNEDGVEYTIQFAPESWFIGDRDSFYFNQSSIYNIDAIEDTRVILLAKDFANKASEISANFRNYNEFILQNHVRQLQKRISLLISASAEERYLDFVKTYPDLLLRAPQWMIASYLGITPQGLSRVRRELAKKNFKPG